jgi:AraC-like DNA-binding protein
VTEIAFRWGFRDAAHFARVFKARYERTPSEVRRDALDAAPRGRLV